MDSYPEACIDVRAALPLYVGGDLDPSELSAVEGHLTDCPACQDAQRRSEDARAVLAEHDSSGPTPDLWSGIRAQLSVEGRLAPAVPTAREPLRLVRGPRLLPVGVASAAAAVLFAFLVAGLLRPPAPGSGGTTLTPGSGGTVLGTTSVGHRVPTPAPQGGLRPVTAGEESLYMRAREMRAEQGIVAPSRKGSMSLAGDGR